MSPKSAVAVALLAALAACNRGPAPRQYELNGQILAIRPEARQATIRHRDIKGFMTGMTMPLKVNDAALLEGNQSGDLVTATLVVEEVNAYLSSVTRTGSAPLDPPIVV